VSASTCALMRWAAPARCSSGGLRSSELNWVWEIPTWMLLETRLGIGCCGAVVNLGIPRLPSH
jgi:hypothetical protein